MELKGYLETARVKTKQILTYHPPTHEQLLQYTAIRDAAAVLFEAIEDNTPACADRSAALRKVREAMMTANAAIATGGVV